MDFIFDEYRKGYGNISAAGGTGWGGGGGGRISLDCYSIQEDLKITVHGLFPFTFCTLWLNQ
jgi:hypothetical protein